MESGRVTGSSHQWFLKQTFCYKHPFLVLYPSV
jgi:hypothetical protein